MKLFKYYSFDNNDYSINGIKNTEVYFSDPLGFNDPFDSKPHMISVKFTSQKQVSEAMARLLENQGEEMKKEAATYSIRETEALIKSRYEKAVRRKFIECGVTCYSKNGLNNAMWYYYADKHSGFVLEFDHNHPYFEKCYEVTYSNSYPYISGESIYKQEITGPQLVQSVFLNKSEEWKHEEEWRCIHNEKAISFRYDPNMLTGIHLGKDCTQENELKVKVAVKHNILEHVKLYKLNMVENSFKLKPVELNRI